MTRFNRSFGTSLLLVAASLATIAVFQVVLVSARQEPEADANATAAEGLPICRLEFTGNRRIRDRTLYRIFNVEVGRTYSQATIDDGIRRLNKFGKLRPVTASDVVTTIHEDRKCVGLQVTVAER